MTVNYESNGQNDGVAGPAAPNGAVGALHPLGSRKYFYNLTDVFPKLLNHFNFSNNICLNDVLDPLF